MGYPVAVLMKVVGTDCAGLAAVGLLIGGTFSCFLHLARRLENHTCGQEHKDKHLKGTAHLTA